VTLNGTDIGIIVESLSPLEKASVIVGIVGGVITVLAVAYGIACWWWRRRNRPGLRVEIHHYRGAPHVRVFGLPSWTTTVTAYVHDGKIEKKLGPDPRRADLEADFDEQHLFGLNTVGSRLDESVPRFGVEVYARGETGEPLRVFKRKVRNEIATRVVPDDRH